ncbi:conjugal transfer nickase/helicase domain-containing protein [Luteimonas panaciterrae]|uniref:conjugal transfer nickase/helicase domain-containing protein n=1 Tax=Luteimonas panaciterrae TaxID=363885 RepID=UPI0021F5980D|nr:DNA-binding domain-containing protein [Luteimonas panaciterrae]
MAKDVDLPAWQWLQKQFGRAGPHRKHAGGLNIWTCMVTGARRKARQIHGYLLKDPTSIFTDPSADNPNLRPVDSDDIAALT